MGSCVGPAVISTVSPAKILRDAQALERGGDNFFRFGQPSRADHSAGQIAAARLDNVHAAAAQDFQVGLRGRMLPHVHVHRGSDDDRGGGRQVQRAEKVVGDALGEFGDGVGRGGRDQKTVHRLRN